VAAAADRTVKTDPDPTKNVETLVAASDEKHAELRASDQKFQDYVREAESKYQNDMRSAETRRMDQLASTRQEFQNTIRDMLAESVRTTSTLVSTQLVQIQATFDSRVSKLEAAQWQSAGRSSVADPALQDILARMTAAMTEMQLASAHGTGSSTGKHDQSKDSRDYLSLGVSLVAVLFVAASFFLKH
jgi:hypothetical protein